MNILSSKKYLMFALLLILMIILSLRSTVIGPKQIHRPLKYKPRDNNILFKESGQEYLKIPELKLNELNKPKLQYKENTKNIFKSIITPPVKYTPPPVVTAPPPAPPPVPKRNPLEDELKKFQFIGFSETKGKTSIFLSKGDNLFVVSKGEKIEDKFSVKDITQTDIILTIINQTDIEFKLGLKEDQGGSNPGYQEPLPVSYPEYNEPPVIEEPAPIPEEPAENSPVQPDPNMMHRRPPIPNKEGPPPESEF
jgi:hypothetical protein